jgi:aminoglycoside phosphotransferase (APT) family kinase protein
VPSVHDLTRRVVDRRFGGLNRCQIDHAAAASVWERAAITVCTREPQWFHGDVAADNLLNRGGRLAAVNDFRTGGIGDPACDTVIAWTQLGPATRAIFRRARGPSATHRPFATPRSTTARCSAGESTPGTCATSTWPTR